MFHTIITLAYIIPNIYLYIRISQLFIDKKYRLLYTAIYILLALVYPIVGLSSRGSAGFPVNILMAAAAYVLPFYLYLFLLMLAFDVFLIINHFVKLISSEKFRDNRFKVSVLSLILVLSAGIVVGGIINFNTIRTSEYRIDVPARSSSISHLKIAFVADFHLKSNTSLPFVEKFAKKINEINPDLMIYGGDIVEGDRDDGNLKPFEVILSGIKARYGVYAVLGNHEHYAGQDQGNFFDKAGMKVLSDTDVVIAEAFNLAGRNDSHIGSRKKIGELLKTVTDSLPVILIDHRPTEIDQVSRTPVDIQFSGHTHNGQLFPINLITRQVYILSWGYKKIGNTNFFVTSGIRLWGPPVRTTGKSEIMVVDVNFTRR